MRLAALALVWLIAGCSLFGPRAAVPVQREEQSTSSGLRYLDHMEGMGPPAVEGDRVQIEYEAKLEDGTRIDSTLDRGRPLVVRVGEAPLAGLNEGLIGMRAGGKRRLVIPAPLAYGEEGVPGLVPGGASIIIEVELLRRFEN